MISLAKVTHIEHFSIQQHIKSTLETFKPLTTLHNEYTKHILGLDKSFEVLLHYNCPKTFAIISRYKQQKDPEIVSFMAAPLAVVIRPSE